MRVLYICSGNSFRSTAAEALTRLEKPGLEVESAGTRAIDELADPTESYLEEAGAREFLKPSPEQLSERAVEEADVIVCMMPEHREYLEENFEIDGKDIRVWNVKDGIVPGVEPREQLEKIQQMVKELEE